MDAPERAARVIAMAEHGEDRPSVQRRQELHASYEGNRAEGNPPYFGAEIRTRGELLWIMEERGWIGSPVMPGRDRVDLRGCALMGADLRGLYFRYADFSGASFEGVDLEGAFLERATLAGAFLVRRTNLAGSILEGADLSNAYLHKTDLSNADLAGAKLASARLVRADLRKAILRRTDLSGAHLRRADLRGADVRGTRMDAGTLLHNVELDAGTRLSDVSWGGASLTNIDWTRVQMLGDEAAARKMRGASKKVAAYRDAARMYRDLVTALQRQGLSTPASKFRLREQHMERKALFRNRELGAWAFSYVLNRVAGYGERPLRTLAIYVSVVLGFAAAYFAMTHQLRTIAPNQTAALTPIEACMLSITAFHGRGFFQTPLSLGDPVGIVSAAEAVIGLFIEALFVAAFSRRFLNG